jgi:hypothetical protein
VRRQFLAAFKTHHSARFDIVQPFLDQSLQRFRFFLKLAQTGRNNLVGILVDSGLDLGVDKRPLFLAQMDLGHFDLLLFSYNTRDFRFQEASERGQSSG